MDRALGRFPESDLPAQQQRIYLHPVPRQEESMEDVPSHSPVPQAIAAVSVADLELDAVSVAPQQRPLRHQEKYDRAIAVWHELENKQMANMRDFAVAMGIGETKAYNQLCEMDRLGLIHWERKKKKAQ